MPATTLQGLAVDSGASTNTGTASFSNLSVGAPITTAMTPQPPADPCPGSWTCADMAPQPAWRHDVQRARQLHPGRHRHQGITLGSADSLHYVYQQVPAIRR